MSRKGISPIISAVLLIAVSLAVVGIFSGWAPQLTQEITESTGNQTMETIACNEASMQIRSAYYDSENLTVTMRNDGSEDLPDISMVAFDANEQIINQTSDIELLEGSIMEVNISNITEPSYVEAYSGKCGSVTYRINQINKD